MNSCQEHCMVDQQVLLLSLHLALLQEEFHTDSGVPALPTKHLLG